MRKATVPSKNADLIKNKKREVDLKPKSKVVPQVKGRAVDRSLERTDVKTRPDKSIDRSKPRVDKSVERSKPKLDKPVERSKPRSESLTRNKQPSTSSKPPSKLPSKKPEVNSTTKKPTPVQKPISRKENPSMTNKERNHAPSKNLEVSKKSVTSINTKLSPGRNTNAIKPTTKSPSKPSNGVPESKQQDVVVKPLRSETANLREGRTRHSQLPTEQTTPTKSTLERPRTGKVRRENADSVKAEAIYIPLDLEDEVVEDITTIAPQSTDNTDVVDEYEDDFEDYESDFEELSEESEKSDIEENESEEEEEENQSEGDESSSDEKVNPKVEEEIKVVQINSVNERPRTSTIRKHAPSSQFVEEVPKTINDRNPVQNGPKKMEDNIQKESIQNNTSQTGILKKSPSQFFNFAKAEKEIRNQNKLSQAQSRGSQLLDLITLDKQTFGIYDAPPANYEFIIEIFGQSNRKQVFVETEPKEDEFIQTEVIESQEKWTQMPAYGRIAVGGDNVHDKKKFDSSTDWMKMNNFLKNSSQLINDILEEEGNEILQSNLNRNISEIDFSDGYLKLQLPEFLKNSIIKEVIFSSSQSNYLLTSHDTVQDDSGESELEGKSVVCIWNLKNLANPELLLLTDGKVTKIALNPGTPSLVFAGMQDGSLSVWNLRDPTLPHLKHKFSFDGKVFPLRVSTFSTATTDNGHQSAILALKAIIYSTNANEDSQFCHLISLEDLGFVNIWSVVQSSNVDPSGYYSDLGMSPGGSLKLVKTSTFDISQAPGLELTQSLGVRTLSVGAFPHNPNHILVTTDLGLIYHLTRHGGTTTPRFYREENLLFPFKILALSINPHFTSIFATGSEDGCIRIFKESTQYPVAKMIAPDKSSPVISLAWSSSHPALLFSLNDSSTLNIWNISSTEASPLISHVFNEDKLIYFCLHDGRTEETVWSSHIAILLEKDGVLIHKLSKNLSSVDEEEYKKQMEFLNFL